MNKVFKRAAALCPGWQGSGVELRVPDMDYYDEEVTDNGQQQIDSDRAL